MTLRISIGMIVLAMIGCTTPGEVVDAHATDSGGGAVDSGGDLDSGPPDVDAFVPVDTGVALDAPVAMGACTNAADQTVQADPAFQTAIGDCAMMSFGAEPGTMMCIEALGLTPACATCYDAAVHCSIMNCIAQCIGGDSPACMTCRMTNCDPAFDTCSGL